MQIGGGTLQRNNMQIKQQYGAGKENDGVYCNVQVAWNVDTLLMPTCRMMLIVGKFKRMLTIFSINSRSAPETAIMAQFGIETLATMLSLTS
uniref:Uncharacterized protein n=1 Tax=Romanomermis culicivorax TaxID=13658 RepID=A0A915HUC3_ROMCU